MIAVVLRRRLIFAPPLLSAVIKPFSGHEHTFQLFELVKEYMPEKREAFLKLTPNDAAKEFIKVFTEKYFPIKGPGYLTGNAFVKHLITHIPVDFKCMTRSEYEPFYSSIPPGRLLAEMICECPFERDTRITVADMFKKEVGEELANKLLKMLPAKGLKLKEVEAALKDSPYSDLLIMCRWIHGRTGNRWMDRPLLTDRMTNTEPWSREAVDLLTRDWPGSKAIEKRMKAFDSWCGHHRKERYTEVIKYIAKKRGTHGRKK